MARKGLDIDFLHYGIRRDDLEAIKKLAAAQGLNPEGVIALLKSCHEQKVEQGELQKGELKQLLKKQLNHLIPNA